MIKADCNSVTIDLIEGTRLTYTFSQSKLVEIDIVLEGQFYKTIGKVPVSRALEDIIKYTKKENYKDGK